MQQQVRDGLKEYDSLKIDIEGIFNKLEGIIKYQEYQNRYNEIISLEKENATLFSNKMYSSNMKLDYETNIITPSIRKLLELKKDLEKEILPFYELNLLNKKINNIINDVNEDNINDLIREIKQLIIKINRLNTHNREDFKKIINDSYKIIYLSLLHEETLDRDDIITYLTTLSTKDNIEAIGKVLRKDLDKVSEDILIEEDLNNLPLEGLGYDYLNSKVLKSVSKVVLSKEDKSYRSRRENSINDLTTSINELISDKELNDSKLKEDKRRIKKLRVGKIMTSGKALSYLLIPAVSISLGNMIGKGLSNRINEYKTITKTTDLRTNEIIGDINETYDEVKTIYAYTVLDCSPWKRNNTGSYIRDIIAYDYHNIEESDYYAIEKALNDKNKNSLNNIVIEKYRYKEVKKELNSTDSTKDKTILLTETYQDKNDTRKSTKYIIPLTISGLSLGIVIDILLLCFTPLRLSIVMEEFKKLDEKIKQEKLNKKEVEDYLKDLYNNRLKYIKEDYNEIVKKYGKMENEINFNEIEKKLKR